MKTIAFSFTPKVSPKRQQEVLQRIETLPGVIKVAQLKPDTKIIELRRMYYAQLDDSINPKSVLRKLRADPEIESAAVPADRFVE
jgi:hypothetical protein